MFLPLTVDSQVEQTVVLKHGFRSVDCKFFICYHRAPSRVLFVSKRWLMSHQSVQSQIPNNLGSKNLTGSFISALQALQHTVKWILHLGRNYFWRTSVVDNFQPSTFGLGRKIINDLCPQEIIYRPRVVFFRRRLSAAGAKPESNNRCPMKLGAGSCMCMYVCVCGFGQYLANQGT